MAHDERDIGSSGSRGLSPHRSVSVILSCVPCIPWFNGIARIKSRLPPGGSAAITWRTMLLQLTNLSKHYAAPGGGSLTVLDDISLGVNAGESLAIVGPSGSGKSTLLQIIGTLDHPTGGRVELDGKDLSRLDELQLAAVRNSQIGFVFQSHFLLPQCTVLENVLVPTLASSSSFGVPALAGPALGVDALEPAKAGTPSAAESAPARTARLLKRVGLGERLHHFPGQLSGGERQRVAVVRALINQPQLLLADEPTGALDHASADNLGQLLVELNREEGVTLIVVTHSRELAKRMGRVLELKDGKLK
jgi:lipoprotein-releasing system ATP-binding protein